MSIPLTQNLPGVWNLIFFFVGIIEQKIFESMLCISKLFLEKITDVSLWNDLIDSEWAKAEMASYPVDERLALLRFTESGALKRVRDKLSVRDIQKHIWKCLRAPRIERFLDYTRSIFDIQHRDSDKARACEERRYPGPLHSSYDCWWEAKDLMTIYTLVRPRENLSTLALEIDETPFVQVCKYVQKIVFLD
jgi:hypothetical protein